MNKRICLVTHDFKGLITVGGIGTYYNHLANLLSKEGWNVVVLYHSFDGRDISKFAERYYETNKIPIYNAAELCEESNKTLHEIWRDANWYQARSHIYYEALQVLMNKYKYEFDLIEFSEWGAGAFIPVRMNKISNIFGNSKIIVKLHSPSQWHRDGCMQESTTPDDLRLDFLERYSFENADIQVSPTSHLLKWSKSHGWKVRTDASICRNPLSLKLECEIPKNISNRNEIIFFGRFEERKGVMEFIEALNYIKSISSSFPNEYRITFIGKEDRLSKDYITSNLDKYECNFFTFTHPDDVIKYLAENARLVVIPSRLDNFPNTVLECMFARIPLITSRAGGIPEMLGINSELYEAISCDITHSTNLGEMILGYLNYNEDYIKKLLELAYQRVEEITDPQKIAKWYYDMLYKDSLSIAAKRTLKHINDQPSVTILIPYYNMHKYIENTFKSLMNQTYKNFDVILINDGSTDPRSLLVLNNLKNKYPSINFLYKGNGGIGSALNHVLPNLNTKYIITVDADNITMPNMVETFVKGIENHKNVVALSAYFAAFKNEDENAVMRAVLSSKKYSPRYYYKPIGPCLPLLFFDNTQGDASSIYLTKAVKSIGGWPENRSCFHDWSMWIKLLTNGYDVDVIPEILFYYRDHSTSDAKTKKLFNVDECNISFIRALVENRPDYFSSNCYESLHRLIRCQNSDLDAKPAIQELNLIKNSALYVLGVRLGKLAAKSPIFKRFLEFAGRVVKKDCR